MKGETTIQLFDANTGKLTDEVTKHNLVTGAVNDFLKILTYASFFNYGSIYNMINKPSERSSNNILGLYGGLLIFSEPIDESHKYPIGNEILSNIGYAGMDDSFYDIDDTYAGRLNSVESKFDDVNKRYKFVWDFPTHACNGDIASICLTNKSVGNRGLLRGSDKLLSTNYSIYDIAPNTGFDRYFNGKLKYHEFNPKNGIGIDGSIGYDNNIYYSSIIPDYNSIIYNNSAYLYNYGDYRFITSKLTNNILNLRLIKKDGTYDDYTYDFTNFKSMLSSEGLNFNVFNIIESVCSSFSLSDMCFYICNFDWIAKFNISSNTYNFARLKERPKRNPIVFRYTDIPLCLVDFSYASTYNISSSKSRVINDDLSFGAYGVVLPNITSIYYSSVTSFGNPNTFLHSDDYSYHFLGDYAFPNACYLATINNQSDVLTKTPDKTMKIIYTLYEE